MAPTLRAIVAEATDHEGHPLMLSPRSSHALATYVRITDRSQRLAGRAPIWQHDAMTTITPAAMGTKTCAWCGETKPLDEYGRHKRRKDGRQPYCRECSRRRCREYHENNKTRGAVDYPAGKLCPRCGQWGVVVLGKDGKPSTRLGSDWGVHSGKGDGLRGTCRHCSQQPEKRRPRRLQSCPDCDDQTPRELKHFARVPHGDGTESYSEFCRLHHMARGGTKQCGGCDTWKPATAYHENAGTPDGLVSWCADCRGEYRAENRDAIAAYNAAYYAENREYYAAYNAAYYQTDHGRAVRTASFHRRRARIALADCGCVTPDAMEAIKALNGGKCVYCDAPADTVEHLYALANGNALNCVSALVPSCGSCNSARQHRPLREFAESRGVNIDDLWAMTLPCDRWDEGTVSTVRTISGRKVWPFESATDPVAMRAHAAEMTEWAAERESRADAIEKLTDPLDASPLCV